MFASKVAEQDGEVWKVGKNQPGCPLSTLHDLRRILRIYIYERPPKPPTIRNSYTKTLVLDTIMKLSGTIGVTQKTMTFDTHVCLIFEFEDIHHAS